MSVDTSSGDSTPGSLGWRVAGWVLFSGTLAVLFGTMMGDLVSGLRDPHLVNDDVRQHIPPLFRCFDDSLFPDDRIVDYYLQAVHPVVFKWVYCIPAAFGMDPATTSRVLTPLLLLAVVVLMAWTTHRIAGPAAGWTTAALVLGSSICLERMTGGLQRGFAFPILAATSACLATGRIRLLAVVVVVAAGLYPPAAFVSGVALALVTLFPDSGTRGDVAEWSAKKRVGLLSGVVLLAIIVMAPTVAGGRSWGARLTPNRSVEYPEVGPGGRYSEDDRFGSWDSLLDVGLISVRSVRGESRPWVDGPGGTTFVLVLLSLAGWVPVARRSMPGRRVTFLPIAAFLCAVASVLLSPLAFIPQRFIAYPIPVFVMIVLGSVLPSFAESLIKGRPGRRVAGFAAAGLVVLLVGGRGDGQVGLNVNLESRSSLLAFVGSLPMDTLVAGWPGGAIEEVPWVTRRSALTTAETQQVFHEGYLLEMRARMRALVDVFFATDDEALARFRDETGADILVVEPQLAYGSITYFKPFDEWVESARDRLGSQVPAVLRVDSDAVVYREGTTLVLDLRRLP